MSMSRRRLLALTLGLAIASLVTFAAAPRPVVGDGETEVSKRVVFVILGGGVRSRDMQDDERMPNLARWVKEGLFVERVESGAQDATDGTSRLLTGRADALPDPSEAPVHPTLMEVVRADLSLDAHACWYVSFEGAEALKLAASTHERYGPGVAPAVTHGAGPFGEALSDFFETRSRPYPLDDRQAELLQGLRAANVSARGNRLPPAARSLGTERLAQIERVLLAELDARNLYQRGAAVRDRQALRCAETVLTVHRPVLTVVRLGEAEKAERSEREYFDVLRENDERLALVRQEIEKDPEMAAHTLWVIAADRGRNRRASEDGALRADERSADREEVAVLFSGRPLARRARVKGTRSTLDVAPTIAAFLGATMPDPGGRVWEGVLVE